MWGSVGDHGRACTWDMGGPDEAPPRTRLRQADSVGKWRQQASWGIRIECRPGTKLPILLFGA